MLNLIIALVLLTFSLTMLLLHKVYYYLPESELKLRAREDDSEAKVLFKAVAYGQSLRLLLWTAFGLMAAVGSVMFVRATPAIVGFIVIFLFLWAAYGLIPKTKSSNLGRRLAVLLTPIVVWLLNYLHPLLDEVMGFADARISIRRHTGLYTRDDLVNLLYQQQHQADSRITKEELELAKKALEFGSHKVRHALVPRARVRKVSVNDTVGPVLLDELHKNGLTTFPVFSGKEVAGLLHLKDVGIKTVGHVRDFMDKKVYYLNEKDTLAEALHVFYQTKCPLFVVVDNFEEYIGVLPVESILYKLLGKPPRADEFSDHRDKKAVAARRKKSGHEEKLSETPPEVVE